MHAGRRSRGETARVLAAGGPPVTYFRATTVEYLRRAPQVPESSGVEVQIGGPDVLTYEEMLDRMALAMGKQPRPKLRIPLITPWLSALWLGLVTPVDTKVARPLVEGLKTPTVITDGGAAERFGISPAPFARRCARRWLRNATDELRGP